MDAERVGFWARLWLAVVLFWKVVFDARLAARVRRALRGEAVAAALTTSTAEAYPAVEPVSVTATADPTPALQLLSILQREGRFLDFLEEDVSRFSDAEIGAAARVVHQGCKRGLREYIALEPVRSEPEETPVVLERGFDPTRVRVTGNVVGGPPFRGRLAHHGWRVEEIHLPVARLL